MRIRFVLLAAVAAVLIPGTVAAQWVSRQFSVTPRGGFMTFDDASGIDDAPFLGVEAAYAISPNLSIGTGLSVSRPQTIGDFFVTQLAFADTTFFVAVQQPLMMLDIGLTAQARYPGDRLTPFVTGGVGYYTLFLDPQAESRPDKSGDVSAMAGAGLHISLGQQVGIQLEVRDLIFTGFQRDDLNPIRETFRNTRFIEDFTAPPEAKTTVHNLMFGIGFSFVPQSGPIAAEPEQGENR